MGWSVIAVILLGMAQIRVLTFGLVQDFPRSMTFGFGRRGVVARLANFRPHVLPALLDSVALVLQLPAVLFVHCLFGRRCWVTLLALGNDCPGDREQSCQNHVCKPLEDSFHLYLLSVAPAPVSGW